MFFFLDEAWFATTRVNVDVISSVISGILARIRELHGGSAPVIDPHGVSPAASRKLVHTHTHTHTHKMYMCTHTRIHTHSLGGGGSCDVSEMLPFSPSKIMRAYAYEHLVASEKQVYPEKDYCYRYYLSAS